MVIVTEEIKRFCQTTSIRGVPKIAKSQEIFLKIVWTIFLLACSIMFAYFFFGIFYKYYQWPVTTRFGENIKEEIVFPDITICSLNRFVNNVGKDGIRDYFQIFKKIERENFNCEMCKGIYNYLNSISGLVTSIPKEKLKDNDCPNLIVDCQLYSQNWQFQNDCTNSFKYSWNDIYRGCYTITPSLEEFNEVNSTRGMTLLLNNGPPFAEHIPYYMSFDTALSNGVTLVIHSPGTPPDFMRGFSIGTGTENIIKIVQTKVKRLHKPHNPYDCTSEKYMENSTKEKYSRDICLDYCFQNKIFNICSCVVHGSAIPEALRNISLCGNLSGARDGKVNKQIEKLICVQYASGVTGCEEKCLLPCSETTYDHYVATSQWPPKFIELGIFENYIENCLDDHPQVKERFRAYECLNAEVTNSTIDNMTCGNYKASDLTEIAKSFMFVKIVIEDDFPYSLVDKPVYEWVDMLGLIGGMLSLWLGISVMTFAEILELFYFILKRYFGKLQGYLFKAKPQVIS